MDNTACEKISTKEKLGFMSYSTASNIIYNFKGTYYLIFLTNILEIPLKIAGIMLAIGTIWDALNDPLITILSTNHKFKNGEKIRPYALYFAIPWALSVVLLFTNFNLTPNWTIAVGLILYFIFEALYTYINIPYNSLASLATPNEDDRIKINSFRGFGSCLGSLIGTVAIIPLIKLFGGLKNGDDAKALTSADSTAMTLTVIVLAVICVAGCLIQYFTTKERVKDSSNDDEHIGLIEGYKILFKCKTWILNVLYIVGYSVSTALIMNNINYYAQYNLKDINYSTLILGIYLVFAILTAVFLPMISNKMGRNKTMTFPLIIMAIFTIPFVLAPGLITVCINAMGCGIGLTSTFILLNANRNTITDILEAQNGKRVDSLVAGGDGLIDKISQALSIYLFTQILSDVYGFTKDAASQPETALKAIEGLIGFVPLIICILLIILTLFINPDKELKQYKK